MTTFESIDPTPHAAADEGDDSDAGGCEHLAGWDAASMDASEAGATERAASVCAAGALPSASDAQLCAWIEAIVLRDERALAALYDATFALVYGLVLRIVRRVPLAEEVVEDAYFQVWRQAARFDASRGAPLAWMLTIARSRAIDSLRRGARDEHMSLDAAGGVELLGDEAPAADELLDLAQRHAALHQALLGLGAQPRQLLSLAFFRGLTHEEIAQQTQLPLGTVKSQIRRALLALREALPPGMAGAALPP